MMPVGRVVAVATDSQNKDAAYWVAKHISYDRSLDDVSTMLTGLDPYRTTPLRNPQAYTMFQTNARAQAYLKGVEAGHGRRLSRRSSSPARPPTRMRSTSRSRRP